MNYLFAGLRREGLRPVWLNAWHHQEEQQVLGSLLEQVRSQAIRPWWRPSGLWFRLRLVYERRWAFQVAAAVLLAASAFGVILSPARRRGAARPGITPSISRAGSGG